jgi:hypothetical protein
METATVSTTAMPGDSTKDTGSSTATGVSGLSIGDSKSGSAGVPLSPLPWPAEVKLQYEFKGIAISTGLTLELSAATSRHMGSALATKLRYNRRRISEDNHLNYAVLLLMKFLGEGFKKSTMLPVQARFTQLRHNQRMLILAFATAEICAQVKSLLLARDLAALGVRLLDHFPRILSGTIDVDESMADADVLRQLRECLPFANVGFRYHLGSGKRKDYVVFSMPSIYRNKLEGVKINGIPVIVRVLEFPRIQLCTNCHAKGHVKKRCTSLPRCACGATDHVVAECPQLVLDENDVKVAPCNFCGKSDHVSAACPHTRPALAEIRPRGAAGHDSRSPSPPSSSGGSVWSSRRSRRSESSIYTPGAASAAISAPAVSATKQVAVASSSYSDVVQGKADMVRLQENLDNMIANAFAHQSRQLATHFESMFARLEHQKEQMTAVVEVVNSLSTVVAKLFPTNAELQNLSAIASSLQRHSTMFQSPSASTPIVRRPPSAVPPSSSAMTVVGGHASDSKVTKSTVKPAASLLAPKVLHQSSKRPATSDGVAVGGRAKVYVQSRGERLVAAASQSQLPTVAENSCEELMDMEVDTSAGTTLTTASTAGSPVLMSHNNEADRKC